MRARNTETPVVICAGAYILDILGRPITEVSKHGSLIEQIVITAAGTAGGTIVDLAALGMNTIAVGTIGADNTGAFLTYLLKQAGVDTTALTVLPNATTSASILPIHPDGSRPAWHMPGANTQLTSAHIPLELLKDADAFHLGGLLSLPSLDGPELTQVLKAASETGLLVTGDCLGAWHPDGMTLLADYLPYIDIFMPNDTEALRLTGASSVGEASRALYELGAGAVLVTTGADGMTGIDSEGEFTLPAHKVEVVDSTGCGDAFAAGVIARTLAGYSVRDAARYGIAAAALTLGGLGSDAGKLSPERVEKRLAEETQNVTAGIKL